MKILISIPSVSLSASTDVPYSMYCNKLKRSGFAVVGEGTFSTVFADHAHPDRVIKVSRLHRNTNSLAWLQWCQDVHSKYVPKVHSIATYEVEGDSNYMVVSLEKFVEAHPTTKNQMREWCISKGIDPQAVMKLRKFPELEIDAEKIKGVTDEDLRKVLNKILDLSKNDHYVQDLTGENIYIRYGEFVFVDPVEGGKR